MNKRLGLLKSGDDVYDCQLSTAPLGVVKGEQFLVMLDVQVLLSVCSCLGQWDPRRSGVLSLVLRLYHTVPYLT